MSDGTPGNTLLLTTDTWDLCIDSLGNIAMAAPPYALAQDVASAARTWLGEVLYDTTVGVPYQQILGQRPPASLVQAAMVEAAMTVPGVVQAECILTGFVDTAVVAEPAQYLLDSGGNPVLDSSGNPIITSSGDSGLSKLRQLTGQILFVDLNGAQQGVSL
jgi:hypothetical protein